MTCGTRRPGRTGWDEMVISPRVFTARLSDTTVSPRVQRAVRRGLSEKPAGVDPSLTSVLLCDEATLRTIRQVGELAITELGCAMLELDAMPGSAEVVDITRQARQVAHLVQEHQVRIIGHQISPRRRLRQLAANSREAGRWRDAAVYMCAAGLLEPPVTIGQVSLPVDASDSALRAALLAAVQVSRRA